MTTLIAHGRKALVALVSATVLVGSVSGFSGTASAKPIFPIPGPKFPFPKFPLPKPMPKPGPSYGGFGPAAFVGGLALGAIATGVAVAAEEDCPVVRRVFVDDDGNEYVRRIRICD